MLLVFFVQVPALAIDIPDIQNKLFESSVSVKVGALKEGATGFFATPPGSNKQVIVTCLHCIIDNIQLNRLQMGRSVDMGQIWVQSLNGGNTFATKVIAYHAKADLVYLQSPFKQKMPELLFAEHAPEPEEMLFSLRYDWKKPEDTFSFSQSKMIATRNDHGTGEPSHIYHWGQTMLTGFSGGALVNEFSEVVGINFMTANPYYNLAEHYRGFKFIRWLEKPMDATTFFSGPMDVSNIAYNDVFWGLSSMEDQGFGYDINLIFNAYQNLSERTFVNFFFSRLMYDFWFDPLMDRIDPTSVDEKSEVALNKVLEVAGAAKKKF
ncbi:MAG: trypsin-like peptidase domain-containing protein, partial [Proteobacteria bacterium]|nr:trypsin-like peptidase domain-containing protein [Pseudomonadota bacterium]